MREGEGGWQILTSLGTDKWSKYSLTNWLTTRTNEFKTAALKNVKAGYIRKWNIKLLERYFDKYFSDQSWAWNKLNFYSSPKFFLHQKSEIWRIWWHIQSEDSCALLVFDTSRGGPVVVGGTRAVPCNQVAPTLLCSALLSSSCSALYIVSSLHFIALNGELHRRCRVPAITISVYCPHCPVYCLLPPPCKLLSLDGQSPRCTSRPPTAPQICRYLWHLL